MNKLPMHLTKSKEGLLTLIAQTDPRLLQRQIEATKTNRTANEHRNQIAKIHGIDRNAFVTKQKLAMTDPNRTDHVDRLNAAPSETIGHVVLSHELNNLRQAEAVEAVTAARKKLGRFAYLATGCAASALIYAGAFAGNWIGDKLEDSVCDAEDEIMGGCDTTQEFVIDVALPIVAAGVGMTIATDGHQRRVGKYARKSAQRQLNQKSL